MDRVVVLLVGLVAIVAGDVRSAAADSLWRRAARTPAERDYAATMERADGYAELAAELANTSSTLEYRDNRAQIAQRARLAIDYYEKAAALAPAAAEPRYRAAEVLNTHFIGCARCDDPDPGQVRRAIDHWRAFERLAPRDPRLTEVYARRAIAHSKLNASEDDTRAAMADYERMLGQLDTANVPGQSLAMLYGNLAEMYMGVGDLDRSIERYRDALDADNAPLHAYGLAVALDRDGQGAKARELMRAYAESDVEGGKRLAALSSPTVFFKPDGEVNYYFALGLESLGRGAAAADRWRDFLRKVPDSRYADRARQNLAALEGRNVRALHPRLRGEGPARGGAE